MSEKQKKIFGPVLSVILMSLGVLYFLADRPRGVIARNEPMASSAGARSNPTQHFVEAQRSGRPMETEIVTLRPSGFEPKEIKRPKGSFLLVVINRSRLAAIHLLLDDETGSRDREARVPREKTAWRNLIDLNPGRYLLKEADHPEWFCRITITSQ